jgi:hypothetical protein
MDAFLCATAKIIVFNKRAQQIGKYTPDICSFQPIVFGIPLFLPLFPYALFLKAELKSLDLHINCGLPCLFGSFLY